MRSFTIYSFYTQDTPYKEVVQEYLLSSVAKFNNAFETKIIETHNYKHWGKNVAQKPQIILSILNENKDGIVLIDADATIEAYPQLFHDIPEEYDIAFHTLDWNTWYRNNSNVKELLTGTMYFRNRQIVKDLCAEWNEKAKDGSKWEQKILEEIIKKYPLKIYDLPIEYCYIKTLPSGQEPHVKIERPIIIHHQVSRTLKKNGNL